MLANYYDNGGMFIISIALGRSSHSTHAADVQERVTLLPNGQQSGREEPKIFRHVPRSQHLTGRTASTPPSAQHTVQVLKLHAERENFREAVKRGGGGDSCIRGGGVGVGGHETNEVDDRPISESVVAKLQE